ncbi:MAG TPA: hypothetical protein VHO24_12015 [Opitutaceae bacterium]|nr:hypothetical protein [Opitutaceae bacterium]
MELRLHFVLIATLATAHGLSLRAEAPATPAPVVRQFPLNERTVYEILISRDAPTTLMFPSAPTAIEAANVSVSTETPAPVMLAYTPGRYFFSVRATEVNARAAINVVWKNKTYVLRLAESAEPFASVTFSEEALPGAGASSPRRVTPEVLLGLLDRAKNYALVQAQHPQTVSQIEHARPGSVTYYRDFRVTVEEVFRFDPEDTLVFRLCFENTSEQEVIYLPQRLAARIGQNVYSASIADASGIVPPKAATAGYFAITGTPRGERANLSLNNVVSVIVPRVERDAKLVVTQ